MAKMKSSAFVAKAIDIAKNFKTLYVMGCFGAPLNATNKKRYCQNHSYNKAAKRTAMIKAASSGTFGFDCVCLIKAILWGWSGDENKTYGGAKYASNGVPDISADTMITKCSGVKTTDWADMVPGEALWTNGHIGIYIGDGLAVESSPAWKNSVQITAVKNIGAKAGYNARTWKKHGRLPYLDYTENVSSNTVQKDTQKVVQKVAAAQSKDKSVAGSVRFKTTAAALNVRSSASSKDDKNIIKVVSRGTKLTWYGFYTGSFYLVQFDDKSTGFVHRDYLTRA